MWRAIQHTIARFLNLPFGGGYGSLMRLEDDMKKHDGFTFKITSYKEDGWIAECLEVPEIVTGSNNMEYSVERMESLIKDAIFTAYGVPPRLADERLLKRKDKVIEQYKNRLKEAREHFEFDSRLAYGL